MPLRKKLGLKQGIRTTKIDATAGYAELLGRGPTTSWGHL
mgnify:CR=1 FL=1